MRGGGRRRPARPSVAGDGRPPGSRPATGRARDFLLEIGVEEMPASACRAAIDLLPERVAGLFAAEGVEVDAEDVEVMVSPRRIAVLIKDVPGEQAPREIVQRGPAVEAAFDADGKPTKACEGFARAKGVSADDLEVREEAGRRFVYYVTQEREPADGRAAARHLPQDRARHVLPQEHALGISRRALLPAHPLAGGPVGRDGDPVRHRRADLGKDEPRASLAGRAGGDRPSGRLRGGAALGGAWWSTIASGKR